MSSVRELLAAFAYPEPLVACIADVAAWIDQHLPVSRLMLLGSTARGEASWHVYRGSVNVLSDLEFYLLTTRSLRADERQSLTEARRSWQGAWAFPNPFFHIDISINPETLFWRKLRFDRRIAAYEVLSNAIVLVGEDFEREPHLFGPEQLDLGNTNELVLVRLWMQLLFTPVRAVRGEADDLEWLVLKYALCRNVLEVLTILLPNRGVLLPSYRQREQYFRDHAELHDLLPDGAVRSQAACLEAKLHPLMPMEWHEYYAQLLTQYLGLLRFLVGAPPSGEPLSSGQVRLVGEQVVASRGSFMRDGWLPMARRARREVRLAVRYRQDHGAAAALRWLRQPRRCVIVAFLLYMHWGLYELLRTGQSDALEGAADALAVLDPSFEWRAPSSDATVQWLELRRSFIAFMGWWQYNDRHYLEHWGVAEWAHD
jgi:hypothetical protein